MKDGDRVRIKREWCGPGEEHLDVYVVVEARGDRAEIAPAVWDHPIIPRETVRVGMLDPANE
jgi:hypothetical protein